MDGDTFLIKMVKERPALWNKDLSDNGDRELKLILWTEIAQLINVETDWIKKRWCNLRERFVKDLRLQRQRNEAISFEYYKEMSFLKSFIRFRDRTNNRINDYVSPNNSKDSEELLSSDQCNQNSSNNNTEDVILEVNNSSDNSQSSNSSKESFKAQPIEFFITKDDLVETQPTDSRIQEIFSYDQPDSLTSENEKDDRLVWDGSSPPSYKDETDDENEVEPPKKLAKLSNTRNLNSNGSCSNHINHEMCEDKIFGELVTAILMKKDEETKRQMKKEILLMLL